MTTPTPPSAFPDVEAMIVDILEDDSRLSGAIVAVQAPTGFDGTAAAVFVNRRGGAWVGERHVDQPLIELEGLANDARQAVLAMANNKYGTNLVTDVEEQDGPRWLPDCPYSAANRYVTVMKVYVDVY